MPTTYENDGHMVACKVRVAYGDIRVHPTVPGIAITHLYLVVGLEHACSSAVDQYCAAATACEAHIPTTYPLQPQSTHVSSTVSEVGTRYQQIQCFP